MKLSIIVPLYNEQNDILIVLNQLVKTEYPAHLESVEFVIIDDHSTDNSYEVVKEYIKNRQEFRLFRHEVNKGKGAAVKTGISYARGDVFLVQDADLELSPSDIPAMVNAMKDLDVQFINGSRYLPGIARPLASYKRYWGNRLFTNLTSVVINVKLTDMACGYKLIHRDLYEKIELKENRFGFEAELIIKALRIKRNNVAEVPVKYFPRNAGEGKKLNNMDAFKILWTIFKYGVLRFK
ncbi:MAG TPA: glycosyltransferase family 2 protein [Draconibacterium sp.]|nr:glycosyltransferase family 2 protein [Draconibacterium sp.]